MHTPSDSLPADLLRAKAVVAELQAEAVAWISKMVHDQLRKAQSGFVAFTLNKLLFHMAAEAYFGEKVCTGYREKGKGERVHWGVVSLCETELKRWGDSGSEKESRRVGGGQTER